MDLFRQRAIRTTQLAPRTPKPATRNSSSVFTTSRAYKKGEKAFAFSPYSKDYSRLFILSQL
jgi:hypothetical protein